MLQTWCTQTAGSDTTAATDRVSAAKTTCATTVLVATQPLKQQSRKDPRQQQFHPEPGPQVKQDAPRHEPVHERQELRPNQEPRHTPRRNNESHAILSLCVCHAWLWGQLSFRTLARYFGMVGNVNSCGGRYSSNVIERLFPGGFVGSRNAFQQYFGCDRPFLGQLCSFPDPV